MYDKNKLPAILKTISSQGGGFLTSREVVDLQECISHDIRKNLLVLVRCGASRYLSTLDQLNDRLLLTARDGDYVRDISVPATPGNRSWLEIGYVSPYVGY